MAFLSLSRLDHLIKQLLIDLHHFEEVAGTPSFVKKVSLKILSRLFLEIQSA